MNDELIEAIVALKNSIDQQNALQEENSGILRSVDEAVSGLAQELADAKMENFNQNTI